MWLKIFLTLRYFVLAQLPQFDIYLLAYWFLTRTEGYHKRFMADENGFLDFAREVMAASSKRPVRHQEFLISRLQDVVSGGCDRLMVQMPPGTAKSTYGSVLFPAYFLALHKDSQIIAAAHTASLASYFGRRVRNVVLEHGARYGLEISKRDRAAAGFSTVAGGEYFAAGVRGPITGRRADLIIIDDPIKSWAEAESLAYRDALYDWYRAELTARLKPGGRIVLIMTRWHPDDLAGRLMASESAWSYVTLPSIAGEGDMLERRPGEVLWPELNDEAAVMRRRTEVGERAFAAMYQQDPRPSDAALFKVARVRILAEPPPVTRSVRSWDLAASVPGPGRNPDYTVGLKLGVTAEQRLIVLDVVRFQGSPAEVEARILSTAKADGQQTMVALPQDPGQAGAAQVAMLTRDLKGFSVVAGPETGSKVTRAMPAATQVDGGNLAVAAAPWNDGFLAELGAFPESRKDDQVDALSRAVNTLITTHATAARRLSLPMIGR